LLGISYTINEIAEYALARDLHQGHIHQHALHYVSFDTRTIQYGPQTIFVALTTENRDGHDFIYDALQKGVKNFIVDRPVYYPGINYVLVPNTLDALQLWALNHRNRIRYPIVGITGSNGKTTVKEWLSTLLEWEYDLIKSPLSYNSQIGVPISLLRLRSDGELGIIEAGISRIGEMELLAQLIQPQIGILTHMGDAHADGFDGLIEKLEEKCKLFENVDILLAGSGQSWVTGYLDHHFSNVQYVGTREEDHIRILRSDYQHRVCKMVLNEANRNHELTLNINDQASQENALLAILAARTLGVSWESIRQSATGIFPISMRTEIITDNPEITLINDSYNSDFESIQNSFQLLTNISAQPGKKVILTDMLHQGAKSLEKHREVYQMASGLFGQGNVYTIGSTFKKVSDFQNYPNPTSFIQSVSYQHFIQHTVLLKGARAFELEQLIPFFNHKRNATYLEIDLHKLVNNYRILKSYIPEGTKTMCVVKASSYGSGTWEIARELESEGATYLAVAYTSEGIELRNARIQLPIMVMNPDIDSISSLIQYDLEPEVANMAFLRRYLQQARLADLPSYKVHLKLETGMGRLGFVSEELSSLCSLLASDPHFKVISVMSHFAAADDPDSDDFTHQQVQSFLSMYTFLQRELGISPFRHILNSKGILRFPQYAFDMVRMGAGLYGINTTDTQAPLEEIGSLISTISQIRTYPPQTSIGYGRSQYTDKPTRIATVALGYADGVPRNLSNGKYSFVVKEKKAPIFGKICMDMTMIDITDIPDAETGDEVLIFGTQNQITHSVEDMARQADTIPYEILVRIGSRVRRIYTK